MGPATATLFSLLIQGLTEGDARLEPLRAIVEEARARPFRAAARLVSRALGAHDAGIEGHGSVPIHDTQGAIFALDLLLNEPRREIAEMLGYPTDRDLPPAPIPGVGCASCEPIDVAAASLRPEVLVRALAGLDVEYSMLLDWKACEPEEPREELAGAVEGEILATERIPGVGWAVVGGLGPNRYDMSRIAAVFEPGGDDHYDLPAGGSAMMGIVDLGGNDEYVASRQGLATGFCGMSFIDDRAGNDRYETPSGLGLGMLGIGVIVDRAGDDRYRSAACGLGFAGHGVGILFDLAGNDEYASDGAAGGVAGPGGVAALIDLGGSDRYDFRGAAAFGETTGAGVPAPSLALFWDAGAESDRYAGNRRNGQQIVTNDSPESDALAGRRARSIFVDEGPADRDTRKTQPGTTSHDDRPARTIPD